MKDIFWKIIAVVAVVLMIFAIAGQSKMQEEIDSLKSALNNGIVSVQNTVNSIYANIDSKLEAEGEILEKYDWYYGEVDYEKAQAEVIITALPKQYIEGATQMKVFVGGEAYSMKATDKGAYETRLTVSVFDEVEISGFSVDTEGVVSNCSTDSWSIYPYSDILPSIGIDFWPDCTITNTLDGKKKISFDGYAFFNIYSGDEEIEIESAVVTAKVDGEAVEGKFTVLIPDNGEKGDYLEINSEVSVVRSFTLDVGQTVAFEAEIKDSNGYTYKSEIYSYTVTENSGSETETEETSTGEWRYTVYNAEGKLLHEAAE